MTVAKRGKKGLTEFVQIYCYAIKSMGPVLLLQFIIIITDIRRFVDLLKLMLFVIFRALKLALLQCKGIFYKMDLKLKKQTYILCILDDFSVSDAVFL